MIAYKGFRPGLICRGYQFVMGLNTTEKANCRENGFMRITKYKTVDQMFSMHCFCIVNSRSYCT